MFQLFQLASVDEDDNVEADNVEADNVEAGNGFDSSDVGNDELTEAADLLPRKLSVTPKRSSSPSKNVSSTILVHYLSFLFSLY